MSTDAGRAERRAAPPQPQDMPPPGARAPLPPPSDKVRAAETSRKEIWMAVTPSPPGTEKSDSNTGQVGGARGQGKSLADGSVLWTLVGGSRSQQARGEASRTESAKGTPSSSRLSGEQPGTRHAIHSLAPWSGLYGTLCCDVRAAVGGGGAGCVCKAVIHKSTLHSLGVGSGEGDGVVIG